MTDAPAPIWAVWINTDLTEGRGRQQMLTACKMEVTALRRARGQDVQGSDGTVEKVQPVLIDGVPHVPLRLLSVEEPTAKDLIEAERLIARRAALARALALGLTEDEIARIAGKDAR